ncbi:lysophospholipid acyltransferase family protein [Dietzia sp.]|uniref:lysophospholipid acyltransferase family protein n=1 Tax=Dietzia sp. TaxID=1871616 RepID=UPI002FD8FE8B
MAGPEFDLGARNADEEVRWKVVGESFTGTTSRSDAAAGAVGQTLEQIVSTAKEVGLHLADVLALDPKAASELMEPILRAVDKADVALATGEAVLLNSLAEAIAQVGEVLATRLTGRYEIDDFGFDAHFQEKIWLPIWRPFFEKWFRVEVIGAEHIPSDGSALIVSNHAGVLPMDGMMTMVAVHDYAGRNLRMLAADLAMGIPVVAPIARRVGATLASAADAEALLTSNEIVAVWPEGFKGLGKPFGDRYRLQRFGRGGFVSTAVASGAPIIPLSVVGSEEIYPKIGEVPALARLLGLPYMPITPTFPLMGLLGAMPLPTKWIMEFGKPIETAQYGRDAADDPMIVFEITDQVRETIQNTLYRNLARRGSVFFG